jgi:hypothetical protein
MPSDDKQNAIDSATPESLERAGAQDGDAANRPGEGPPVEFDGGGDDAAIDGAADTGPGTAPEGATPEVDTGGDPLADAHE